MKEKLKIYIGYDSRQDDMPNFGRVKNAPFEVCKKSILKYNTEVSIQPIILKDLVATGIYKRELDPLASTEFTYSRFLTPYLNNFEGKAVFCDSDFLWQCNIEEILEFYNKDFSVMCVQHDYKPKEDTKMDGYKQTIYPRKNWSSLMLFNCAHNDCAKLTPDTVNTESPKYLHRMQWTSDKMIGKIPLLFNWLEGEYDGRIDPKAIHFTNGGPWFDSWQGDYEALWRETYTTL